jgi:N-methylhydantoinase A
VTDALVVLGYIAPDHFLGGEMQLDEASARAACAQLGDAIGLGAEETAWGIREIALSGMVSAVRARLAARGLDPRSHPLMSYGGCGALFTTEIAVAVGSPAVLVPELSSVLSALGAATSDVRREIVQSVVGMARDPQDYNEVLDNLRTEANARLDADGIPSADRSIFFEADMCFRRQSWEIATRVEGDVIDGASLQVMEQNFRTEYGRRYGEGAIMLHLPIEIVALRAIGVGRTAGEGLAPHRASLGEYEEVHAAGRRRVQLGRHENSARDVDVHDGLQLQPGDRVIGPAIVDHVDTTVWIPPGSDAFVEPGGTLRVEVQA